MWCDCCCCYQNIKLTISPGVAQMLADPSIQQGLFLSKVAIFGAAFVITGLVLWTAFCKKAGV